MSFNKFDRIRLWALENDFGTTPFEISATLPGVGAPLDWILFTGAFSSPINSGVRKAGSNRITLTQRGSDAGYKDVIGQNITWKGGAVGGTPVADGSTGGVGLTMQAQTVGNGMRLEVTIGTGGSGSGLWPDGLMLVVYDLCYNIRQISYAASIIGDADAVPYTESIGLPGVNADNAAFLNAFTGQVRHRTHFLFASEVPGAIARLDVTRNSGASMGNWAIGYAVALYKAPHTVMPSRSGPITAALRALV